MKTTIPLNNRRLIEVLTAAGLVIPPHATEIVITLRLKDELPVIESRAYVCQEVPDDAE